MDYAKLVVGTARLYPEDHLLQKLEIYREFDVHTFIGGQFLEYVFATQGFPGVRPYCEEARRLGFEAIEVSDNRVPLTDEERTRLIATAIDCGLEVHGEVGSKDARTDRRNPHSPGRGPASRPARSWSSSRGPSSSTAARSTPRCSRS